MSEIITPTEKSVDELKAEIATLEAAKVALTGELTDTRPKLREAQEKIDLLTEQLTAAVQKNQANPEEQKIIEVVQKVLGTETQKSAEKNREAAFTKFVADNNEYHPDNDTGGLKLAALKREFAQFNTTGLVNTEDFATVIGKAHALLRGTGTPSQTTTVTPYSSTPSQPAAPSAPTDSKVSPEEAELIKQNGWTEERFLALKAKMPGVIEDLIKPVAH